MIHHSNGSSLLANPREVQSRLHSPKKLCERSSNGEPNNMMNFDCKRSACSPREVICSYSMEERGVIMSRNHIVVILIQELHPLLLYPTLLEKDPSGRGMEEYITKSRCTFHGMHFLYYPGADDIDSIPFLMEFLQRVPKCSLFSAEDRAIATDH